MLIVVSLVVSTSEFCCRERLVPEII